MEEFAAYPRQGAIYNVIVYYTRATHQTTMVAQVPTVTYSCDHVTGQCSRERKYSLLEVP